MASHADALHQVQNMCSGTRWADEILSNLHYREGTKPRFNQDGLQRYGIEFSGNPDDPKDVKRFIRKNYVYQQMLTKGFTNADFIKTYWEVYRLIS